MSPEELKNWIIVSQLLVTLTGTTVQQVMAMFRTRGLSDAALNAILAELQDDAARREAISRQIADGEV